ncbi:hypothetical protein G436_4743 [Leptospira interrogans serovar Hardjo str. Norma]|uniref:Uncharacterized protein n=1 Tax=Leptospira interrogans serovar Hardjo str. Norma TaxID=1279460 RepID=A0A0M4MYG4_LEPIR|nr:hypothetical protein G436_4743 [Leptospira interrogans serovar Hardjo str. Norma]
MILIIDEKEFGFPFRWNLCHLSTKRFVYRGDPIAIQDSD